MKDTSKKKNTSQHAFDVHILLFNDILNMSDIQSFDFGSITNIGYLVLSHYYGCGWVFAVC